MNIKGILLTCFCTFFHFSTSESTSCGQTIIADNGTITYKLADNYDAGELCVFMIKFESGYIDTTFNLDTHGLSNSDSDAVTVFGSFFGLTLAANLGHNQQSVTLTGFGAVVIFRTNSSSGTGFQLSFKPNRIRFPGIYDGTYAVFDNNTLSPLNIPANDTGESLYNYFVFTSGSRLISEPDTFFRLTAKVNFENPDNKCSNGFHVYSFVDELQLEKSICERVDDGVVFEFSTRGLFFVYQDQDGFLPPVSGVITWETDTLIS
ncbi:hypothetical protein Ocin01_17251 [Orchesella cincta]|uniref:CUB domain-containing protein n=1 Tax=Orchesella cincta TaxID=48709 RepID=A0A1D2M926_ORCCI|nr:hypothetical protein Ocin01_17251 [Orchesella cincta]